MTFDNEYPNSQAYPSAYPYSPRNTSFPYSHYYHHLVRSEPGHTLPATENQSVKMNS